MSQFEGWFESCEFRNEDSDPRDQLDLVGLVRSALTQLLVEDLEGADGFTVEPIFSRSPIDFSLRNAGLRIFTRRGNVDVLFTKADDSRRESIEWPRR